MKRIAVILAISLTVVMGVIASWVISIRPWQSKILAHGFSPEGREYCIVQTFKGFIEPYQVSFYIRNTDGIWKWNYLAHQDNGWKTAKVGFTQGSAVIERNGETFKGMDVPDDHVDLNAVLPGHIDEYCPGDFSVGDVLAFHNQKYNECQTSRFWRNNGRPHHVSCH